MFLNNAINKIESKRRKLFDQLNNTCKYYNCDKREFHNEFRTLKEQYSIIDCFSVKTYYGEIYFSCSNPCFTTFKSF
jgi:hypothetical protein